MKSLNSYVNETRKTTRQDFVNEINKAEDHLRYVVEIMRELDCDTSNKKKVIDALNLVLEVKSKENID